MRRMPKKKAKNSRPLTEREQKEQDSRRTTLVELSQRFTDEELAEKAGTTASMISQMRIANRNITDAMRERIEDGLGRPRSWMDRHIDADKAAGAKQPTAPIAKRDFLDSDLRVLDDLMHLPPELQRPIRKLIDGAFRMAHPNLANSRPTETETD